VNHEKKSAHYTVVVEIGATAVVSGSGGGNFFSLFCL
jgi:hypothetical protein